jgi:hypothetical protein
MFPPNGTGPAAASPAAEEQAKTGNRKLLLAAGGVVAALVVGAGAFFLLSGGGGDQPAAAPAKGNPAAAASPSASASPSAKAKPATTIKTVTVAARDPFAVLFPPTPSPAATTTTTNTTGNAPSGTTPAPVSAKLTLGVSAINVGKQTATITVDGVKYATSVGKVFAKTFVMYSVFNTSCVGLLYGDQNVAVCSTTPVSVST